MNRHRALAIVLSGVLVCSVVGGVAAGSAAVTAPAETSDELPGGQDGAQNETISLVEAMEAAANETADRNGTVVGAERGQTDGLLDFGDDDEGVYTVDALLANGTHVEVAVNATNGSVVDTEEQEEGFLEGIFEEDEVPDEPLNLSAMHNATEAVQLAQNETDENATVASVNLDQQDDTLVYDIQFQVNDEERTVTVAALKDGGGVIDAGDGGVDETETETGDGVDETATAAGG